jgi:tRNA nucleotidyltransferase (CCA-adding enzyme)
VHRSGEFGAAALVRLLERCDALRRPDRFAELLLACECDMRGRLGFEDRPYPPKARLAEALRRVQAVDASAVAEAAVARGATGPAIGRAIHAARVDALRDL